MREIQDMISMVTHNHLFPVMFQRLLSLWTWKETATISRVLDKGLVMMSEMRGCFREQTQFKGQTLKHNIFNYVGPASPLPYV